MNHTRAFSPKTIKLLSQKEITIVSTQAVPAYDGDKYFSGVAYLLDYKGKGFMRTHSQVVVLALSSWNPETDLV